MEGNMEERMSVFLASLHTPPDGFLGKLRERAVSDGVPIIRLQMESLLQVLLAAKQPKRILEAGTAVGYSALLMAEHTKDCSITTIEKDPVRPRSAKENFAMHPEGSRITLLEGDAQQSVLSAMRRGLILSSWMPQRASICIFCRMCLRCWSPAECWFQIMCCRKATFWNRTILWSGETGQFISACAHICMS